MARSRLPVMFLAVASAMAVTAIPALAAAPNVFPGPDDFGAVLQPIVAGVAELVVTVLGFVGLWLGAELKRKWGFDIEASVRTIEAGHREALHSAVTTGLGAVLAKLGPLVPISADSVAGKILVTIVKASVPEAVAALKATDAWIISAANSKLALGAATAPTVTVTAPDNAQAAAAAAGAATAAAVTAAAASGQP